MPSPGGSSPSPGSRWLPPPRRPPRGPPAGALRGWAPGGLCGPRPAPRPKFGCGSGARQPAGEGTRKSQTKLGALQTSGPTPAARPGGRGPETRSQRIVAVPQQITWDTRRGRRELAEPRRPALPTLALGRAGPSPMAFSLFLGRDRWHRAGRGAGRPRPGRRERFVLSLTRLRPPAGPRAGCCGVRAAAGGGGRAASLGGQGKRVTARKMKPDPRPGAACLGGLQMGFRFLSFFPKCTCLSWTLLHNVFFIGVCVSACVPVKLCLQTFLIDPCTKCVCFFFPGRAPTVC